MDRPKLRKVDRFEQTRDEERLLVLRDPLGVAEPVALDADLEEILDMLDGSRTLAQVRQSLLMRGSFRLEVEDLAAFVEDLGQAGLLEDDRFRQRWRIAYEAFQATDPRPPRLGDIAYPTDRAALTGALQVALPKAERFQPDTDVLGVIVPHGPLELTGSILDATLRRLPPPGTLDFVVILGTDHSPGLLPYVATGKRYATPLGIAPAATDIFAALKRRLPWIVREEIRHRDALSVELAVLYLQYLYGTACPPILPILCGQTSLSERAEQETDRFLATLEGLVEDSNMLWWTSAELSHAGQAYGRPSLEPGTRAVLRARDEACLEALRAGRPDRLARHCSTPHPQGRLSGGAAVTTLSRLLPVGYRTEVARYMMVEAPGGTPGALGLAGVRLARPI